MARASLPALCLLLSSLLARPVFHPRQACPWVLLDCSLGSLTLARSLKEAIEGSCRVVRVERGSTSPPAREVRCIRCVSVWSRASHRRIGIARWTLVRASGLSCRRTRGFYGGGLFEPSNDSGNRLSSPVSLRLGGAASSCPLAASRFLKPELTADRIGGGWERRSCQGKVSPGGRCPPV
jgi:hypothetical protein